MYLLTWYDYLFEMPSYYYDHVLVSLFSENAATLKR